MRHWVVAIVGMGARGLGVLERISAIHSTLGSSSKLTLFLVDSLGTGQGVHSEGQARNLLTNTVASQITMFNDTSVTGAGPVREGPCFWQWARQVGYRNLNGDVLRSGNSGREIDPDDYLPRAVLGEYLTDCYRDLFVELQEGLKLHQVRQDAVDFIPHSQGVDVLTSDGYRIAADFVFITTGHGKCRPSEQERKMMAFKQRCAQVNHRLDYIRNSYPLDQLQRISSQSCVAIQGTGLTAYDVISELTVGRKGQFVEREGRLEYIASGLEPEIVLFSRNSLPFSARAKNQKGTCGQYRAQFLTLEAIDKLRAKALALTGSSQLSFTEDVYPLLLEDMASVYAATKRQYEGIDVSPAQSYWAINNALWPLQGRAFESLTHFSGWVKSYIREDLEQAQRGNVNSPIKAAMDVIRDIRDNLRYAIDHCGLTSSSHQALIEEYCPVFNRVAVGPPLQRNRELLALLEQGIVNMACGPRPTLQINEVEGCFEVVSSFTADKSVVKADVLVQARLDSFSPLTDTSPLIRNLYERGVIRAYFNGNYHPGGIDVDKNQHPINQQGEVQENIWALGNLVEGPNFYTYVLPRPGVNSRSLKDAGCCVLQMFNKIAKVRKQEVEKRNTFA
ncbi:hypothetical protein EXN22_22545 [Pseudomonas tructae]|uniref:FAD-dependent urate hydroxylase HpyO/Asp monooxygenase CreE-like FAD/NAD(P)-binding domain-containing protein n=1 Tax=Pseudomonas tructae TaxID=2518644 RepID=A0A411MNC8_9PSED|nr:FAD/NAD(P)-binding domain-containing protein [Pseudomonas tructae]QBF28336.1 hypothetical protein EXN22_22545 [Pseudomonas tructae]